MKNLATVTYAHHSLIAGQRKGALYGSIATVILAVVFTCFHSTELAIFLILAVPVPCSLFPALLNTHYYQVVIIFLVLFILIVLILPPRSTLKSFNVHSHASVAIINKKFYTTDVKDSTLPSYWVTGFADAEACFFINVNKKNSYKIGWGVQCEFNISIHIKDLILLRELHLFFGVGSINVDEAKNMAHYRVASLRDITNIIIPHFDKYPLITQKKADFLLFKQGANLLNLKAHREIEGLREIISLKASMNRQRQSEKLISNFPGILPHPRPRVSLEVIPDPNWFTGFVDGEGHRCFYVSTTKSKSIKIGVSIALVFSISQHARDELLLTKFIEYLGCGIVYKFSTRPNSISFTVSKFKHITKKVIPFFQKYPLKGIKALDFQCFCEISKIMESKGHLTDEGLKKIRSLKSGMNANRNLSNDSSE